MYKSIVAPKITANEIKDTIQNKINEIQNSEDGKKYKELDIQHDIINTNYCRYYCTSTVIFLITFFYVLYFIIISSIYKVNYVPDFKNIEISHLQYKISLITLIILISITIILVIITRIYNYKESQLWYEKDEYYDKGKGLAKKCHLHKYVNIFTVTKPVYNKKMKNLLKALDKLHEWENINNDNIIYNCYITNKNLICNLVIDGKQEDKIKIHKTFWSTKDYAYLTFTNDTLDFSFIDNSISNFYRYANLLDDRRAN